MIKNLEITILKEENIFHPEPFNIEFLSVAYYFLLKLKKIKVTNATYIKINIINRQKSNGIKFDISSGVLFIGLNLNFSEYLLLSKNKKTRFQCEMLYDILKTAFKKYHMDWSILDTIIEQLQTNNWKLKIELLKKKVLKKYIYTFKVLLDIDSFTYVCIIEEGNDKKEIIIFKSIALYFSMLLFQKFKIINNKEILIGNEKTPFFKIDIVTKSCSMIKENKSLIDPNLFYKNQNSPGFL